MLNLGGKNSGGVRQFLPSGTFGQTHPRALPSGGSCQMCPWAGIVRALPRFSHGLAHSFYFVFLMILTQIVNFGNADLRGNMP